MLSHEELLAAHRRMTSASEAVKAARASLAYALEGRKKANDAFNESTGCHWDNETFYYNLDNNLDPAGYVNTEVIGDAEIILLMDDAGIPHLYQREQCQDFNVKDSRGDLYWFNEIPVVSPTIRRLK